MTCKNNLLERRVYYLQFPTAGGTPSCAGPPGKQGVGQESEGMRSKYGLELVLCFPREKIGETE